MENQPPYHEDEPQPPTAEVRLGAEEIEAQVGIIQEVFREVAPIVMAHVGEKEFITKARDDSPVTPADIEVEGKILAELKRRMPGVPVFGEESGYENDMPGSYWLIDPIDGTKPYIEGIARFTTMAVLIQDGQPVASVIFNPTTEDMYTGQHGRGTFKNGERIDLAATSLGSMSDESRVVLVKRQFEEPVSQLLKPAGVRGKADLPAGGGWEFTQVLDGRAAGRINLMGGGYPHDYATGALLVQEAGGAIIPYESDSYDFRTVGFAAVHPELAPLLREHVQDLRGLEQAARAEKARG